MLVLLILIICLALSIFGLIMQNRKYPYDTPALMMLSTGMFAIAVFCIGLISLAYSIDEHRVSVYEKFEEEYNDVVELRQIMSEREFNLGDYTLVTEKKEQLNDQIRRSKIYGKNIWIGSLVPNYPAKFELIR